MTTPSSLRKEIKNYLFDTNIRWAMIHTMILNKFPITLNMKEEYEVAINSLISLIKTNRKIND